ncbi:MAG: glycosyltransferase family 39 protein [Bacteroidota bacterium]
MSDTAIQFGKRAYWEQSWSRWVLLGMIAMIYLINRSPYPGFDDGLGFLLDAETGFNFHTNATNHVLYNNLQHLLAQIFFFVPTVWVLTMLVIVSSVLTLYRIMRIGDLFTGPMVTSLMPVIILGLSFTYWQQSEIIEVYAFNNLLFVHFLYYSLKDLQRGQRRYALWVSLLLGLGLLTHIQNILSIPYFLYYLLWGNELSSAKKATGLAIFASLFFLLFIPPLTGNMNSASAVFFDRNFQGNVTEFSLAGLLSGMSKGMLYLAYNFHMFLMFILHGWYLMWRDRRNLFGLMTLLLVPYLGFAIKYNVNDNHVFFLIPYILIVLPSVFSFSALAMRLIGHMSWMLPMLLMMSPMLYGAAAMMGKKIEFVARYDAEKAYKGGAVHLLWPGKAWAKDPLALAKQLYQEDPEAYDRGEVEWNYPAAVELLRRKGEI